MNSIQTLFIFCLQLKRSAMKMVLRVYKTNLHDFYKNFLLSLREYLTVTTLHGFHYLIDQRTLTKKIFWLLLCVISLIFSAYLIYLQTIEYNTNVTSNPLVTTTYPVWERPFPAFTVCNYNLIYKASLQHFYDIL